MHSYAYLGDLHMLVQNKLVLCMENVFMSNTSSFKVGKSVHMCDTSISQLEVE